MNDATSIDQISGALNSLPRSADFDVDPTKFSPSVWLNHVLSSSPSSSTSGSLNVSALLEQLHASLTESHESLDRSLHESLKAVPWVIAESDKVRQRTNSLRAQVDGVGKRVSGVESGVISSVKTIADADTIVKRVQNAVSLLETTLNSQLLLERLESLLASVASNDGGSNLVTAADVASQLRKSLLPLKNLKQMEDRIKQLDSADKRLEGLAAPQLKSALENQNVQGIINARIVFDHAGRENAFKAQYVNLSQIKLFQLWSDAWTVQQQRMQQLRAEAVASTNTSDTLNNSNNNAPATQQSAGEFTAEGADDALKQFYDNVCNMVVSETEWLQGVFPDLKTMLLPALLCESLNSLKDPLPRANIFIHPSVTDTVNAIDVISDRLYAVGEISILAAARIAKALISGVDDHHKSSNGTDVNNLETTNLSTESKDENDQSITENINSSKQNSVNASTKNYAKIIDTISSVMIPYRMFWECLLQIANRQGKSRAESIKFTNTSNLTLSNNNNNKLNDIAKDVELCAREACMTLDIIVGSITKRSCGIGIAAMKQAAKTICTVLAERLQKLLSVHGKNKSTSMNKPGTMDDEWTKLGGALRLLMATSSLKRSWDTRKEAALAVAIGSATPVLEIASAVKPSLTSKVNEGQVDDGEEDREVNEGSTRDEMEVERIYQFLNQVENNSVGEAGVVWELVRIEGMSQRVESEFETIDSSKNDFEKFVNSVHSVVYDTMFSGITNRFESFSSHDLWSTMTASTTAAASTASNMNNNDNEITAVGLSSSSPLRYATEVADYLMAIPQQLEPFVPDEEDSKFATPSSVWQFCKSTPINTTTTSVNSIKKSNDETNINHNDEQEADDDDEEDEEISFAGMWISVLAMGTMELFVEKVCSITRLSENGAKQLATDADYLCNVMGSLGVTPTQDMTLVCKLLECKKDAPSFAQAAAGFQSAQHRKLIRRVGAVRGVNVTL